MTHQNASVSGQSEKTLSLIHDSIQRTGFARVSREEAASFNPPNSPENCPHHAFIWKMFGLGFALSYEEADESFVVINAPETSK